MAQYLRHFSNYAVGNEFTTLPAEWSVIQNGAGDWVRTYNGKNLILNRTSTGSFTQQYNFEKASTDTDIEILYRFKTNDTLTLNDIFPISLVNGNSVASFNQQTADTLSLQFYGRTTMGTSSCSVNATTIAFTYAPNTWYWVRYGRYTNTSTMFFRAKIWSGNLSDEPGAWMFDLEETTVSDWTAPTVPAITVFDYQFAPFTLDFFSVGTQGDSAPSTFNKRVTVAQDDFNGGAENPITGDWLDLNNYGGILIQNADGTFGCETGNSPGSSGMARRQTEAYSPDQYSEVEIQGVFAYEGWAQHIGVLVRAGTGQNITGYNGVNCYWAAMGLNTGGNPRGVRIGKTIQGVGYTLFEGTYDWAIGDRFGLEVVGTQLSVTKNGVPLGGNFIITDDDLIAGNPGIAVSGGLTRLLGDNWSGGNILPNQYYTDFNNIPEGPLTNSRDFSDVVAANGWTRNVVKIGNRNFFVIDENELEGTTEQSTVLSKYAPTSGDIEVVARWKINGKPSSGYGEGPMLIKNTNSWAYSVEKTSAFGTWQISEFHGAVSGWTAVSSAVNLGVEPSANDWIWIRLGRSGTTIRAKVWLDGTDEPIAWQLSATSTAVDILQAGMWGTNYITDPLTFSDFGVGIDGASAPTHGNEINRIYREQGILDANPSNSVTRTETLTVKEGESLFVNLFSISQTAVVSSAVWDSGGLNEPLVEIDTVFRNGSNASQWMFYLANPTPKTGTLLVTFDVGNTCIMHVTKLVGADRDNFLVEHQTKTDAKIKVMEDNFDRADDSTGLGLNWDKVNPVAGAHMTIVSNLLTCPIGVSNRVMRWNSKALTNDQYCQLTLQTVNTVSDNGIGPAVRIVNGAGSNSNMYFSNCSTVETRIYKRVGGVYTQLGSDGPGCISGDIVRLEVIGNNLKLYKNGSVVVSATDGDVPSGLPGVWGWGDSVVATGDDWEAGNIDTSPVIEFNCTNNAMVIAQVANDNDYQAGGYLSAGNGFNVLPISTDGTDSWVQPDSYSGLGFKTNTGSKSLRRLGFASLLPGRFIMRGAVIRAHRPEVTVSKYRTSKKQTILSPEFKHGYAIIDGTSVCFRNRIPSAPARARDRQLGWMAGEPTLWGNDVNAFNNYLGGTTLPANTINKSNFSVVVYTGFKIVNHDSNRFSYFIANGGGGNDLWCSIYNKPTYTLIRFQGQNAYTPVIDLQYQVTTNPLERAVIVYRRNGSTNYYSIMLNGVQVAGGSELSTPHALNTYVSMCADQLQYSPPGYLRYAVYTDRYISDDEAKLLTKDPWRVFQRRKNVTTTYEKPEPTDTIIPYRHLSKGSYPSIDWSNPLTKNLNLAVIGKDVLALQDLTRKHSLELRTPRSTMNELTGRHGKFIHYTNDVVYTAGYDVVPVDAYDANKGGSCFVLAESLNAEACIVAGNSGRVMVNAAGKLEQYINSFARSTGLTTVTSLKNFSAAWCSKQENYRVYLNGIDDTDVESAVAAGSLTGPTYLFGDPGQITNQSKLYLLLFWNQRYLTADEVKRLHDNPWQVFKTSQFEYSVFTPAGETFPTVLAWSGITNAHRAILVR